MDGNMHYYIALVRYHVCKNKIGTCCSHAEIAGGILQYRRSCIYCSIPVQRCGIEHKAALSLLLLLVLLISLLLLLLYSVYRALATFIYE